MQPFNKYYPPDWTPDKGTANKFQGTHALGDRARKLNEGILIVRFEMPFNVWCLTCDNHIGQGVRYNAQKKQIGKYYSSPILQFRMKCHLCDGWIEIHTDPKNHEYKVVSGARKKVEEWDSKDNEVIQFTSEEEKEKLESDPIYRLEHGVKDKKVIEDAKPHLTQLRDLNESQWSDPYTRSQQLRKQFRLEKKKDKQLFEDSEKIRDKHSLQIELLPETPKDSLLAKMVEYKTKPIDLDTKRLDAAAAPLFSSSSNKQDKALGHIVQARTRLKTDPFYNSTSFSQIKQKTLNDVKLVKKKRKVQEQGTPALVTYSDSDDTD